MTSSAAFSPSPPLAPSTSSSFFDAHQLYSKPELSLRTLKSEFSIVSSSFLSNNPDKKSLLFFFDIEFQESQESFSRFGITALPHIRLIQPSAVDLKNDSIELDGYSDCLCPCLSLLKMPLFLRDKRDPSKMLFFYQGSGIQLGAEGFSVGFLYTIVGLLLAFLTHVLVKVRNRSVQRWVMMLILFVLFWAVQKVVLLGNWKSGYRSHAYWPSSWR
ncbi:UNVERIFIED_CONTAM: putative dolichyl-diphosphooligosaccharide--protein glycosyltransferase subunitB [Sesamum radiatum]|uniref:Dolichyl-diphosphooligosaccharide--protein glycosyltransferase subunitB n=1 Tax=Sesamum radiatum TaxID=300843 RepID=A0AAW2KID1_SESRA